MKKMNKLTVAALALAALGLASTAASAQVAPGAFDLVLGFQLPGNNSDLEVDLGSSLNFTSTTQTTTLSQLSVADLTSIFGANWASTTANTGVNWSVAGINSNNDGASFYATSLNAATAVRTSSASGLSTPWGSISSLAGGGGAAGSLNGSPSTSNSPSSAEIGGVVSATNPGGLPASGLPQSYSSLEGGTGYGFVNNAEQTGAGSNELFGFAPGNKVGGKYPLAADIGTFALSGTGALTFTGINATTQSVPEPSAYALGICAALLFIVLRRRHTVA